MSRLLLKSLAKDLLPPIVLRLIKKTINSSIVYESYDAAMIDAEGYEDNTLTKVVVAKGKKFAEKIAKHKEVDLMSLRTFMGLASALNGKRLTVIDFGGAAGVHYFLAKSILSKDVVIDWRVVETTQMVKEAKAQGLETKQLSFYDSIDSATNNEKIDLVFASGSIHCTPNPYEFLERLTKVDARSLVITRTPITNVPTVLLQRSRLSWNGVGEIPQELGIEDKVISYPVTMMDKEQVEKILRSFGNIKFKICENKSAYASKNESYDLWGYVMEKSPATGMGLN